MTGARRDLDRLRRVRSRPIRRLLSAKSILLTVPCIVCPLLLLWADGSEGLTLPGQQPHDLLHRRLSRNTSSRAFPYQLENIPTHGTPRMDVEMKEMKLDDTVSPTLAKVRAGPLGPSLLTEYSHLGMDMESDSSVVAMLL